MHLGDWHKSMKKRFFLITSLAAALTASAWWVLFPGDDAPRLVVPLNGVTMPAHRKDPAAKAQKLVSLSEAGKAELFRVGGRFDFSPVDGVSLPIEVGSVEPNEDGSFLSQGMVLGEPGSVAVFSEVDGALAGSVELADGRFFTINHVATGVHRAVEVDFTTDLLDCGSCRDEQPKDLPGGMVMEFDGGNQLDARTLRATIRLLTTRRELRGTRLSSLGGKTKFRTKKPTTKKPTTKKPTTKKPTTKKPTAKKPTTKKPTTKKPTTKKPTTKKPGGSSGNDSARIDLMVVYTPDAAKMFGGEKGIKARINVAVSRSNTAFSDSKIKASLNLVHAGQVNYTSVGKKTTDLRNVSFGKTALKKQVAGLRKKYKADLVTLVTEKDGGGVGWLLNRKSPMPQFGFNVVCASSLYYWVLAHECGHNLGCQHAKGDAYSSGAMDAHGYGWRFQASDGKKSRQYRTIMAYAPGSRIGHFSNPNVKYNGVSTGVANQADNVRVINETAAIVARNSEEK